MTFDECGYPTEETLDELSSIKPLTQENLQKIMEIVHSHWQWADKMYLLDQERGCLQLITGGWSGNEEIIGALRENRIFWALCWYQSRRGGHYWFDLRRIRKLGEAAP